MRQIQSGAIAKSIPMPVTWYLSDIGEAKGKQELFANQSPQRLKVLREHAMAESAISSNRIEGVEIDQKRVGTVIFGHPALRDRNEQEVGGYRDALNLIHTENVKLPVSEKTILHLHQQSRGKIWDAGIYKDIYRDHDISPLITIAAFNLDFLCIHPFRDSNGRVSRLLFLLTCYHVGIEVGRYISLERLIEENKERYYETLQQSSQSWHEGKHNPWPYIGYLLFIIKKAYDEFERRAGDLAAPRGEKSELVFDARQRREGDFRLLDIEQACPRVGRDWIRALLFKLKKEGKIDGSGKGKAARWKRLKE